jgi:hypothetical protein
MAIDYTINWSDPVLKPAFTLEGRTMDSETTSIDLTGKGYTDWGQILQQNLLHLLENFASRNLPPPNPTVGQLWFNVITNSLNVYYSGTWHRIEGDGTSAGINPPANPTVGMLWYDTASQVLKVWNGTSWVALAQASALNRIPMTVPNANNFTIPAFKPGSLVLETCLRTTNTSEGVFNIILKDNGVGVMVSAGQMLEPNYGTGLTNYITPGQSCGTCNPSTGVISLNTSYFTGGFQQWNGSAFIPSTITVAFIQGPYAYTINPAV